MRAINYLFLLFVITVWGMIQPNKTHAQTDTKFWVALPYLMSNHGWNINGRHLVVSTMGSPATVTVSIPANPSFKPIVVDIPANSTERIDMTSFAADVLLQEFDEVTAKGVLIESTDNVTAYMEVMNPQNAEIYALKGKYAQGTDFYVPTQNRLYNYTYSGTVNNVKVYDTAFCSIDIVATENTVITITPAAPIMKKGATAVYPAGVPYTVTLKKGETYSARAVTHLAASHLSGTHITSTQPIVVSYKDDSVIRGGWDLVGDQIIPVSVMGTQYIAVKGFLEMNDPNNEYVFAVIAENGTTLKVDGVAFGGPYTAGTTVAVPVTNKYTVIESNTKKFTCFHLTGTASELAGTILPPTDQCTGTIRAGFSYSYGAKDQKLWINIMVRKGAETGFLLDGKPTTLIPSTGFTAVNAFWSVGQFGPFDYSTIAKGAHVLSNTIDQFHMGYLNTSGPSTVYGYFSDFTPSSITAVFVKTKSDAAVQCVGDDTQLRVDGGIKYEWSLTDANTNTALDATDYLDAIDIYNPVVQPNLPIGKYVFHVKVWGPCGAPPVFKDIKLEVKAAPVVKNITEVLCESEFGSGCVENYDLDKFLPKISSETGLSVVRWRKEVKNKMVMLDDFENERNLTYNSNNAASFNTSAVNPQRGGINPSSTVLNFTINGSSGYFTFSPRGGITLDLTQGAIFSLMIRNDCSSNNNKGLRTVTMKLIGTAGDTIKQTQTMARFGAWQEMTFDYSAAPKKVYSEIMFEFGNLDWQMDKFYIDEIKKLINLQITRINNPDSAAFCTGGNLYVTLQNADQCQIEATVVPTIGAGSYTVNNPTVTLCESEFGTGQRTGFDLSSLLPQIKSGAGYSIDSITGWKFIAKNQQQFIEDFEKNIAAISAITGTFKRGVANPQTTGNASPLVGSYTDMDNKPTNQLSISLAQKIVLSEGYKFQVQMYDHPTANYGLGAITVVMELRGPSLTTLSRTATIAANDKWETLEFDFVTDIAKSGYDEIRFIFTPESYHVDVVYFDNLLRVRTDHEDFLPFRAKSATINNGDTFYAYVKDANGCLQKSTIKFTIGAGSFTVNNPTIALCEDTYGAGQKSGYDLNTLLPQIKTGAGFSIDPLTGWHYTATNQQQIIEDFEANTVTISRISTNGTFTRGVANPLSTGNTSAMTGTVDISNGDLVTFSFALPKALDLKDGAIFTAQMYDHPTGGNSGDLAAVGLTMYLVSPTGTISRTSSLVKNNKWENVSFDFSTDNTKKGFDEIRISFKPGGNVKIYFDNVIRMLSPFVTTLSFASNNAVIKDGDIFYADVKDANGCIMRSKVTFTVKAGTGTANAITATICQSVPGSIANNVDITSYANQIIGAAGVSAGNKVVQWFKNYANFNDTLDDFEKTGLLTWTKLYSGSNNLTFNRGVANPASAAPNTSAKVLKIPQNWYNPLILTADVSQPFDLSKGYTFKIKVCYKMTQTGKNTATDTHTLMLELISSAKTISATQSIHTANLENVWKEYTFTFPANATDKDFDQIRLTFTASSQVTEYYIDDVIRPLNPFEKEYTTPLAATVNDGDIFYGVVKEANGCLARGSVKFTVKECDPPAIDQAATLCEEKRGTLKVSKQDLTKFDLAIRDSITTNTVTWYSDKKLTTLVTPATDVIVSNGSVFYALVKSPKLKQDTATLTYTVIGLPNPKVVKDTALCENASVFSITATPSGGTFKGIGVDATGKYTPSATIVGKNIVTYTVTDGNKCVDSNKVTVDVKPLPVATLLSTPADLIYCGTAGGKVSLTNITGASYTWTRNDTAVTAGSTVTAALKGTYKVTVTLNGCTQTLSDIVVVGNPLPTYNISGGGTFCHDTATKPEITLKLTGTAPWSVKYTNGTTSTTQAISASPYLISTPADGTYTLESISDKNCTGTPTTQSVVYKTVQRPTSSITTTDFEYCGSTSDVKLEVAAFAGASYEWKRGTSVVGGNSNIFDQATAGNYIVTLKNDICKTVITGMTVVSNAKPTYSFSGGGSFCEGKKRTPVSLALTGKAPWSLTYDVAGTPKTVSVTASPYQILDTIGGTYSVKTLSDANVCTADASTATDASASITVLSKPIVSIASIAAICASTKTIDVSASVSPKTGGTGTYYGEAINATSGLFTHTGAKTYRVGYIFTSSNTCVDSAHTNIIVNANPSAAITPRPASVCVSTNLTLQANPNNTAAIKTQDWSGDAAILSDKSIASPIVNTNQAKKYALTYTITDVNGCIGTDTITVRVNDTPSVAIKAPSKVLCRDGGAITLTAVVAPVGGTGKFSPDSLMTGTSFDPKNHKVGANIIQYDYTDKNGCTNFDTVHLFTKTPPSISVSGDSVACIYDAAYSLSASPLGGTFTGSSAITTGGVFTPASIGDATKKVTAQIVYEYSDNIGCTNKIAYPVTVYPRPSLTMTGLADTVCYPQAPISVTVSPISGTLSGSGIDAAALQFTPKAVGQNQSSTITYNYTDSHGCENAISKSVFVRFTAPPTVQAMPYTIIKNDPIPAIAATGKAIRWYDKDSSFLSTVNPYTPSLDNTVEGKFVFKATQTLSGCESNTAAVSVEVNNCPAKAPIPHSDTVCYNPSSSNQLTATLQGAGRLDWFDKDDKPLLQGANSYSISETAAGTYSYSVREYDLVNKCYSSASEVHLVIRALPVVSITGSAAVCQPSTEVKYDLSPVGGEFTGTGIADKTANIFNPSSTPKATATYTLTYKGFETIGTLTCSNTSTKDVLVTYSDAPVITNSNPSKMLLEEAVVTPPSFTATGAQSLEWFDNAQASNAVYTSASPSTFNTQLKIETGATGKSYWVRSINAGCPSELVEAKAIIIACPTPKPLVIPVADCENLDSIRVLRATGDLLKWYNASGTQIGTGAVYNHGLKAAATIPYSFFVTQTQVEPITGKACESQKQEATVTIYYKPISQFVALSAQACVDASLITIGVTTDKKVVSEVYAIDTKTATQQFLPANLHKGSHNIAYTVTDNEGCVATISQIITIDSTEAPVIAATDRTVSEITVRPVPTLKASGTDLKWYYSRNVKTATKIGSTSAFLDASIGEDAEVNRWYYVTQTLNTCQSLPDSIWLRINNCPVDTADVTISKSFVCETETAPTFTARQGTHWTMDIKTDCSYKWYSKADRSETINNTTAVYSPTSDMTIGKRMYYVAEYNNYYQCEGPVREIVFNRVLTAAPAVSQVDDICQFEVNPTFKIVSPVASSQYAWYNKADLSDAATMALQFQSPTTDTAKIYVYAVQVDQYGCKSAAQSASFTIKPKPQMPTIDYKWVCVGAANATLEAKGRALSTYQWKNQAASVLSTVASYSPTVTAPASYEFLVTQSLNNCVSDAATATYTIRPLPEAPKVDDIYICPLRTSIPTFTVTNCTDSVSWYSSTGTLLGSDISFTPQTKISQTFTVEREDNKCKNNATVRLKVWDEIPAPIPQRVSPINTICFATPLPKVKLKATAQSSNWNIQWLEGDSTGVERSTASDFTPSNIVAATKYTYTASFTDEHNCRSKYAEIVVDVKAQPAAPTIKDAWLFNCTVDSPFKTLEASAAEGTISWYDTTGALLTTNSTFTPRLIDLDVNDTVKFYARTNNGCPSDKSAAVNVALYKNPNKPRFNSQAICYGAADVKPIVATAQGTISWFVDDFNAPVVDTGKSFSFNPQVIRDYKIITYTTWNNCKSDTTQRVFTVAPIPTPKLLGTTRFCEKYSNTVNSRYLVQLSDPNDSVVFKSTGVASKITSDRKDLIGVTWGRAGFDTVFVVETSKVGCSGYDTLPIQVAKHSKPSFKWSIPGGKWQIWYNNTTVEDTLVSPKGSVVVHLSKIAWRWGHDENEAPEVEPYEHYKSGATYKIPYTYGYHTVTLKVTNDHGCVDSISEEIFYDIATGLYVPNSFDPEHPSAAINTFMPKGFNLESYQIAIYDQWGNVLWSSDKLNDGSPVEGWDGKYQGQPMKSDVYIWRIKARFRDGREWEGSSNAGPDQYGNLILIR